MSSVFDDELFEEEESSLVRNLLTDLNTSSPGMGGVGLCTIGALSIGNDVFDFEGLLEDGVLEGFGLNCDLDLDTFRMGFRPDERGVDDSDFVQTAELLETQGEEFSRFGLGVNPVLWRL